MEDKILHSVIEITEQRNSISLGHCLIATLSEMLPICQASLTHYIGTTAIVIAHVVRDNDKQDYQWIYDIPASHVSCHDHLNETICIENDAAGNHVWKCPISISDCSSALLTVTMTQSPVQYELLMDGFAKIYRNYLVVLHESERDKLTGLLNRRTLEERLSQCFGEQSDQGDAVAVWIAILDLDHFKAVNDQFGHMIGDEVLLMFAQQLQNFFSHQEQLFRFGGEEFVIMFPPQEKHQVLEALEAFRLLIEAYRFPQVNHVTFSCGLCSISRSQYLPTILDHADKALYFAKESGRNQVKCYEDMYQVNTRSNDDDRLDEVELF
ncbi:GGDEF domain-containing protein [Vibrio aquaticus]|uniref:diguanylate cyclase n=1 Tax=Vibrio aquaticus TaxID=2496559 RepID=A0A432CYW9_9VIBR|nr:GGDEF domain-containing protein [Vibrio aquaticus]RTZ16686.1 GGDEF domain-containing protein [Vibrio aquaticus]